MTVKRFDYGEIVQFPMNAAFLTYYFPVMFQFIEKRLQLSSHLESLKVIDILSRKTCPHSVSMQSFCSGNMTRNGTTTREGIFLAFIEKCSKLSNDFFKASFTGFLACSIVVFSIRKVPVLFRSFFGKVKSSTFLETIT